MVNKNNTDTYQFKQLSILIGQDGFLFYLHHQSADKSLSLEPLEVTDVLSTKSLNLFKKQLKTYKNLYEFTQLKLAFSNSFYSLVPEDYFQEEAKADYLKYNVKLFEEDQIVSEYIEGIKVYQVYIPLMNYHNAILEHFEEFEYEHFTHSLIKHALPHSFEPAQKLWVYVQPTHIDIIAFEGQKFKLCNSFNYETDLDLAYYVLFCVEELKFDQREAQLEIFHDLEDTSSIDTIKRYILNVKHEQQNLAAFIV
ncbi:DUF3822 family protein [Flavobacteriaceae bacterium 14752]|uniref:DUF3822 family protein n=1 Tax=Mesohalobacter salilacus TaxID=2491711 RepID=UPI000F63F8E9|nr:DUF3822 family protein [Flavobacteriaceae bacterium 14752]